MRAADIKKIRPPAQVAESDDPAMTYWLAGFESMRNAVLFLLTEQAPVKPSWNFTPVDANYAKQSAVVSGDSGGES